MSRSAPGWAKPWMARKSSIRKRRPPSRLLPQTLLGAVEDVSLPVLLSQMPAGSLAATRARIPYPAAILLPALRRQDTAGVAPWSATSLLLTGARCCCCQQSPAPVLSCDRRPGADQGRVVGGQRRSCFRRRASDGSSVGTIGRQECRTHHQCDGPRISAGRSPRHRCIASGDFDESVYPGVSRTGSAGQQLQGAPVVFDGVVPGHLAAVFEAQDSD